MGSIPIDSSFKHGLGRKAAYMLTLQELKEITDIPGHGMRTPTAKSLWETGRAVAEERLREGAWIAAYRNGYALYHAGGHSTVFPIHICGDYLYASSGAGSYLPEQFFGKEPWYVRLVLEGEDRLDRNQGAKEQGRAVSYSAVSEEWEIMEDIRKNPLEYVVDKEGMEEMLGCLTRRQRKAVSLCFFQQRIQKEAARELGISSPAVSAVLSQAAQKLRKKYLTGSREGKEAAAV